MKAYTDLLKDVIENGYQHEDRTGTGRTSVVGRQIRFNMKDGFPLVTTRKVSTDALINEMIWFIRGSKSTKDLKKCKIWDKWKVQEKDVDNFLSKHHNDEDEDTLNTFKERITEVHGDNIGPIYGPNWRDLPINPELNPVKFVRDLKLENLACDKLTQYRKEYDEYLLSMGDEETNVPGFEQFAEHRSLMSIDQLNDLICNLKERPYSSRHIVSSWIPHLIPFEELSPQENVILGKGALAPCHMMFQCFVQPPKKPTNRKRLSLLLYIRSNDLPIGAPYNIAQYALLLHLLAHVSDMEAHELIYTIGDGHIYSDQLELVKEQIERKPKTLPKLVINPELKDIFMIKADDITIEGYDPHPAIHYPVSI